MKFVASLQERNIHVSLMPDKPSLEGSLLLKMSELTRKMPAVHRTHCLRKCHEKAVSYKNACQG